MASKSLKLFLCAVVAVLATFLDPVSVQAQNTNTTIQDGQININRTYQWGASNDNTTYQTGKININRTIQLGGYNGNPTGPFGRINHNGMEQGRSFQGASFERGGDERGNSKPWRSHRRGDARRDGPHNEDRQR